MKKVYLPLHLIRSVNTKIIFLLFIIVSCSDRVDQITVVDKPDTNFKNQHYVSNREPLVPSSLIKLPVGSIIPDGWLLEYLRRQKNGLTGNLVDISQWLQKKDNAWLSEKGEGKLGWEEVPYWLKGYANIGYILNDEAMISEAKVWLEGAISSQRDDGFFGPSFAWESYDFNRTEEDFIKKNQTIDFWPNMIMLYCLQSYYEFSNDKRVIDLMTKYFKFQNNLEDSALLAADKYWARRRAGDNIHSVIWLYNRTGDKWLLELAEKIHKKSVRWESRGNSLDKIESPKTLRDGYEWPSWYGDLIDWHNVNIAQGFREPAQYYLLNGNKKYLDATYENFDIVREYFGQVPGGMFGSDEYSRPGYDDPRQAIETCGMVEQMNSDEHMLRITGDIFWADHVEEVAFNNYPAAVMPDFKSLRYLTSPNMVLSDSESHYPGIVYPGPFLMFNPLSSRCCQHNHTQGWPYFAENLWMATPDNGLAAVIYASSIVNAKVGGGVNVRIENSTNYPFENKLRFKITLDKEDHFPLYFRVPSWAENPTFKINGKDQNIKPEAGKYLKIYRKWNNGDSLEIDLPKSISVKIWEKNHNSVSINYGPLTFGLKIKENIIKKSSDQSALFDARWQEGLDIEKWPSYEIHPSSDWNYGLIIGDSINNYFEVVEKKWPKNNFPFTQQDSPIVIKAKGKKIKNWKIDETGLAGELMDSPVKSEELTESIELVPMGAARLRISSFPVIE